MKKYYIALAVVFTIFGIFAAAPIYADHGGPGSDSGDSTTGRSDGTHSGGGGGDSGGGGGSFQPQTKSCFITLQAPVVQGGAPTMTLSWTPTPDGEVKLTRAVSGGKGNNKTTLTVPDDATTFSDSISSLTPGIYTYNLSYKVPKGAVRGASTDGEENTPQLDAEPVSILEQVLQFVSSLTTKAYAVGSGKSADANGDTSGGGNGGFGGSGNNNKGVAYACSASFKVVDTLTQCNDGLDNGDSEDVLIDQQDPGCHTDGNPGNTKTYDPTDTGEGNPNSDVVPTVTSVATSRVRNPVRVTASVKNTSAYYAVANSLIYGWRDTSSSAKAPNCGRGGRNCFTENGHTFLRLNTYTKAYNAGQTLTDNVRSFRPLVTGRYEVCAIADYTNTVVEGVVGEANNNTCRIVVVDDTTGVSVASTPLVDGPLTITGSPRVLRNGQTSTVEWETGGRTQCTITNSTAEAVSFTDADGEPRMSDQEETPPLVAQTTYTITCTDPGAQATATATIRLLPGIKEL